MIIKLERMLILDAHIKSTKAHLQSLSKLQSSIDNTEVETLSNTLIDKLSKDIVQLLILKHDIIETINSFPLSNIRLILQLRYLNMMKWEEIATETRYALRSVMRLHRQGLNIIAQREEG